MGVALVLLFAALIFVLITAPIGVPLIAGAAALVFLIVIAVVIFALPPTVGDHVAVELGGKFGNGAWGVNGSRWPAF